MAHGNARVVECKKCRVWGLSPRFGEGKCPKCGVYTDFVPTEERDELKADATYEWVGWID